MSTVPSDPTNNSASEATAVPTVPAQTPPEQPTNGGSVVPPAAKPRRRLDFRLVGLALLLLISIPVWLVIKNARHARTAAGSAAQAPTVAVDRVGRQPLVNEVTIPAEFRAYQEVEVHAKVSGYVSQMNVDFGDLVKSNQVMATLEVPELQDQIHNAVAMQQKAEADYRAAHLNYIRLSAVAKQNPNLVAEQDLDAVQAKDGIAQAAIAAAKAEVERFMTLSNYTQIIAPFDGVVTHRYVDTGALIQAGTTSETQSLPVVRVSQNYLLRLDFPVSVLYVKDIHMGATIDVLIESLGMKRFKGTIKRFSQKVNDATRTMMTEIEVPNPTLEIVPGMYATVVLKVQQRTQALSIPTQALSGDKDTVYVVNANNEIEERRVTLGLETPERREVISGLQEADLVMLGSRTQVQPGQKVTPLKVTPLNMESLAKE